MSDTEKTKTTSIRCPIDLIRWIDYYSRIVSLNMDRRVTRNEVIVGFIEEVKSIIEKNDKKERSK